MLRPRDPRASLRARSALALVLFACLHACQATPSGRSSAQPGRPAQGEAPPVRPDLAVSYAPHDGLEVHWKQRLAQPYLFLEARGSYTGVGALLEETDRHMRDAGLVAAGPPFALFYDDPGTVPVTELRMRACFPVAGAVRAPAPLTAATLPGTTVVYAFVGGPYPEVPRAYPKLFAFLDELGWVLDGPVREVYLVHPGTVSDWSELVSEVQLPATSAR